MSHNRGKGDVPMVRKDRQNKVCTSKGMKDRRIRLSANTAIQFYDLQDRLGCDRPSNAIDWLMKEAKVAIDALHSHHPILPPAATTIFNHPSHAFHSDEKQTKYWNQDCFNDNNPFGFGLMNLKTERENHPVIVTEEVNLFSSTAPLDFNWNPSYYNPEEGFASLRSSRREPLQSSFVDPNSINNVFGNDNGLLGFSNFQQEVQVLQEDEEKI